MRRAGPAIATRLAWALLAGWLAACGAGARVEPGPGAPPPSVSTEDLVRARQLWQASGARSYRLVVEVQAASGVTCAGDVEVEEEIVRQANLPMGQPACGMARALTVTRLFELVERAMVDLAYGRLTRLDVMFDGHNGVPITIEIAERSSPRTTRYLVRHVIPAP